MTKIFVVEGWDIIYVELVTVFIPAFLILYKHCVNTLISRDLTSGLRIYKATPFYFQNKSTTENFYKGTLCYWKRFKYGMVLLGTVVYCWELLGTEGYYL